MKMIRVTYGKYAGLKCNGAESMDDVTTDLHLDRASWLTAQVESGGKFGTVINYDGTGMTAGIHQAIAVYPRALDDNLKANDQGPLWRLLNRIWSLHDTRVLASVRDTLIANMDRYGMILSPEGKCLDAPTGDLLSGKAIRNIFTGDASGVMPSSGPKRRQAEEWVELFHDLFACHETFRSQLRFGEEHFVKRCERTKLRFCKVDSFKETTIREVCYPCALPRVDSEGYTPDWDLAMCVYWSHSVNAPGMALRKICKALDLTKLKLDMDKDFPRVLLKILADTKYGRWHRSIAGGRYQRTRNYAMKIFPENLFVGLDAIMPK